MKPTTLKDITEAGEPQTAEEALERGISDAYANGEPQTEAPADATDSPEAEQPMPPGHEQLDMAANRKAHWAFRRVAYPMTLIGLVLIPLALLVRTGRWAMRTLVAHDRGWEFPSW